MNIGNPVDACVLVGCIIMDTAGLISQCPKVAGRVHTCCLLYSRNPLHCSTLENGQLQLIHSFQCVILALCWFRVHGVQTEGFFPFPTVNELSPRND